MIIVLKIMNGKSGGKVQKILPLVFVGITRVWDHNCNLIFFWLVFTVRRDDGMLGCWDFPYFDTLNIWILGFCDFYILMLQSV